MSVELLMADSMGNQSVLDLVLGLGWKLIPSIFPSVIPPLLKFVFPEPRDRPMPSGPSQRNLLGLGLVLLIGAFYSAVLADAVLISGRIPTQGTGMLIRVAGITVIVTVILFVSWFRNVAEVTVAIVSTTVLFILLTGETGYQSGGTVREIEMGMRLVLPALSLVVLSAATITYGLWKCPVPSFCITPVGQTLDEEAKSRRERLIRYWGLVAVMALFALMVADGVGRRFRANVLNDQRSPNLDSIPVTERNPADLKTARALLQNLSARSLISRGTVYRLGSELEMAGDYLDNFENLLLTHGIPQINPNPQQPANPNPQQPANPNPQQPANPNPQQPANPNPQQPANSRGQQTGYQYGQPTSNFDFSQNPAYLQQFYDYGRIPQETQDGLILQSLYLKYLENLWAYAATSAAKLNRREAYKLIESRLEWVHPAARLSEQQLPIPLPGRTSQERFATLASMRQYYAHEVMPPGKFDAIPFLVFASKHLDSDTRARLVKSDLWKRWEKYSGVPQWQPEANMNTYWQPLSVSTQFGSKTLVPLAALTNMYLSTAQPAHANWFWQNFEPASNQGSGQSPAFASPYVSFYSPYGYSYTGYPSQYDYGYSGVAQNNFNPYLTGPGYGTSTTPMPQIGTDNRSLASALASQVRRWTGSNNGNGDVITPSAIFPASTTSRNPALVQQMMLRYDDERYVAFLNYRALYKEILRSEKSEVTDVADQFDAMEMSESGREIQRALIHYFARPTSPTEIESVSKRIKVLSNIERSPKRNDWLAALDQWHGKDDTSTTAKQFAQMLRADAPDYRAAGHSQYVEAACKSLHEILNVPDERATLASLFEEADSRIPLLGLMCETGLNFAKKLEWIGTIDVAPAPGTNEKRTAQRVFFDWLRSPVEPVVTRIATDFSTNDPGKPKILDDYNTLRDLSPKYRQQVLRHLAIATYRPVGAYSLGFWESLVVQAETVGPWLAVVYCMLLWLTPVIAATAIGIWIGWRLLAKDLWNKVMIAEAKESPLTKIEIPAITHLIGRDDVLIRLRELAGRGWGAIAVVGRRGVGKTQVLSNLCKSTLKESALSHSIGVWISAPTKFNEDEFIEIAIEQLAINAEASVALYSGVEPLETRRAKRAKSALGEFAAAIVVALLLIFLYGIHQSLHIAEVRIGLFPIAALALAGMGCLTVHRLRLQPINLGPWLERGRGENQPATCLLYRRSREAVDFVMARRQQLKRGPQKYNFLVPAIVGSAVALFLPAPAMVSLVWGAVSFAITCLVSKRKHQSDRAFGLMSLISEYRDFARTVVRRINEGALSRNRSPVSSQVLVCIDELDKTGNVKALRTFLRRMKAIFEIPGVFYYLSVAEDAIAELYLGAADGKNEFDSALDHVVRIGPLVRTECSSIVREYLGGRGFVAEETVIRGLALISFGVPRDVLRICDELLADPSIRQLTDNCQGGQPPMITNPVSTLTLFVKAKGNLISETYNWSSEKRGVFGRNLDEITVAMEQIIASLPVAFPTIRADWRSVALVLVLCYIAKSFERFDGQEGARDEMQLRLFDLGFRLPLETAEHTMDSLTQIRTVLGRRAN